MNPSPEEIRAARTAAGLTQTQAARLVYRSLRTWQQWEAGRFRMPCGLWELFIGKQYKLKYLDGTNVDKTYADAVARMVSDAATATELFHEDDLEKFAGRQSGLP